MGLVATARRLGALVEAYDARPAAQEEVESLRAPDYIPYRPPNPAAATEREVPKGRGLPAPP